jgi:uncharacterized membrane protein
MHICTTFSEINWLAVAAVTVLSFMLGAFWHSVLFNKAWKEDSNSIYSSENRGNPGKIFGLAGISHLAAVIALAMFIGNQSTALCGLIYGLIVSLVWVATSIGVTYLFVGRSFRLFLIDAGFYVVFYSIAGLILGAWH